MTQPDYTFTIKHTTDQPPKYTMERVFPEGSGQGPTCGTIEEVVAAIQEKLPKTSRPVPIHIKTIGEPTVDEMLSGERAVSETDLRAIRERVQHACKVTM